MPKKLKLSDLKVQSFVTSLENDEKNKVKGGLTSPNCETDDTCTCNTYCGTCPTACGSMCNTCSCQTVCGTCSVCTMCGLTACKYYTPDC